MSPATRTQTGTGPDGASYRIVAATDRLTRALEGDDTDTEDRSRTIAEIRDVVVEADRLLETIDLDELTAAVDLAELPNLVDADRIPTAIRTHDPSAALDARTIRHAIRLRELWNAVDLIGFAESEKRLEDELDDVVDEDVRRSAGDAGGAPEVEELVDEIRPEAKNAAIQQQAQNAAREARRGVLIAHAALEERCGTNRGRSASRNPTAVSLVPSGPVPDGVSTRFSSVPSDVRGAKIDALPRIYGRRWRTVGRRGR